MQSKLENIYILALFNYLDVKSLGFGPILRNVIDELKVLQNDGIPVYYNGKEEAIYFTVVTILGDTILGVHTINRVSESFKANFPCRFCYPSRND